MEQLQIAKEKEVILQIIEVYRGMPYLWDKKNKNYMNKNMRNDGNKLLLELYKQLDSDATLKTVTKKIQNLRTGYLKELRKVKDLNRSGDDTAPVYVPTLYYFDAMSFLEPIWESRRPDRNNVKEEDFLTSSSETEGVQRTEYKQSFQQKKKRLTKVSSTPKRESSINTAGEVMHMKEEEWEIIGKGIGLQLLQLKDLNVRQFYIAQKIIHDTLYYAQMGMLTEHSAVTGLEQVLHMDPLDSP